MAAFLRAGAARDLAADERRFTPIRKELLWGRGVVDLQALAVTEPPGEGRTGQAELGRSIFEATWIDESSAGASEFVVIGQRSRRFVRTEKDWWIGRPARFAGVREGGRRL
jgi:hypothetical protein